jgi:hypothetical protein
MLAGVAKFSNIPSYPSLTTLFLPLLSFFSAPWTTTQIPSLDLSIPNLLEHSPSPSFL